MLLANKLPASNQPHNIMHTPSRRTLLPGSPRPLPNPSSLHTEPSTREDESSYVEKPTRQDDAPPFPRKGKDPAPNSQPGPGRSRPPDPEEPQTIANHPNTPIRALDASNASGQLPLTHQSLSGSQGVRECSIKEDSGLSMQSRQSLLSSSRPANRPPTVEPVLFGSKAREGGGDETGSREAEPNFEALLRLFGNPSLRKEQLQQSVEAFLKWETEKRLGRCPAQTTSQEFAAMKDKQLEESMVRKYNELLALFSILEMAKKHVTRIRQQCEGGQLSSNHRLVADEVWNCLFQQQQLQLKEFMAFFYSAVEGTDGHKDPTPHPPSVPLPSVREELRSRMAQRIEMLQVQPPQMEPQLSLSRLWDRPTQDNWPPQTSREPRSRKQAPQPEIIFLSRTSQGVVRGKEQGSKLYLTRKCKSKCTLLQGQPSEQSLGNCQLPSFRLEPHPETLTIDYDIKFLWFQTPKDRTPVHSQSPSDSYVLSCPLSWSMDLIFEAILEDARGHFSRIKDCHKVCPSELLRTPTLRRYRLHLSVHLVLFNFPAGHTWHAVRQQQCVYDSLFIENKFGWARWLGEVDLEGVELAREVDLREKQLVVGCRQLRRPCEVLFWGLPGGLMGRGHKRVREGVARNMAKMGATLLQLNQDSFLVRLFESQ